MIEGIDYYLKELKRIKPLFNEIGEKVIIEQLIYYGQNKKREIKK